MRNKRKNNGNDKYYRILAAALQVFAEKGFYQSKVSEIAQKANVADGTIYLYFKNKDDILISLFEEEMSKAIDLMNEALQGVGNSIEKIRIFAKTHLAMVESNREVAEIFQVEVRQSSKFMKEYKNERFYQYLNIIATIIGEGQTEGIIMDSINPDIAKRAFFGALDEMSRYWVLSSKKAYTTEYAAKQISDMFIDGIIVD